MSLLVFQHESHESSGLLGRVLQEHGHRLRTIALFDSQAVPPDLDDVDGIVSLGGAMNVDEADRHPWMKPELESLAQAHAAGIPVVGICLGAQLLAAALGAQVAPLETPEVGWQSVRLGFPGTMDPIFTGIPWDTVQFHLHGQEVAKLPPDAVGLAGTKACRTQAFKAGLRTYGFQFHFEWDQEQLARFADNGLVTKAGENPQRIKDQIHDHFDAYHRVGRRLCENLATYLFPIDKRLM